MTIWSALKVMIRGDARLQRLGERKKSHLEGSWCSAAAQSLAQNRKLLEVVYSIDYLRGESACVRAK
jgi:hypothetical protein